MLVMKLASLFSGGKDSTYALWIAQQQGHIISSLLSMKSKSSHSWMFHSINIHLVDLLAECLEIPLISRETKGEKERELEDLHCLLEELSVDGVVSGAIASEYQRSRIERLCQELDLQSITPLWGMNQEQVLHDQIAAGFDIRIVGVYAEGLDESWLGRTLTDNVITELQKLHERYGINVAGEGGEYETLVVDGPNFTSKLVLEKTKTNWQRDMGTLDIVQASVQSKN